MASSIDILLRLPGGQWSHWGDASGWGGGIPRPVGDTYPSVFRSNGGFD